MTLVIETHNDLPLTPCRSNRYSAGGLLRWRDMDLAIAVSRSWTKRQSPFLECHQRELLAWMGYDLSPPYREIHGSLDRLRRTAIALYVEGTSQEKIPWFTIFKDCSSITTEHQRGSPTVIRTELSSAWLDALNSLHDWTVVDLDCYAHLARKARRLGLARALYLYFAARRSYNDMSFSASVTEVRDAFADRKNLGEGMCFSDPFNPRSRLFQAMKFLQDEGMILWRQSDHAQTVSGVFQRPKKLISLADITKDIRGRNGMQATLPFDPGIFGEVEKQSLPTIPPSLPDPTPLPQQPALGDIQASLAARSMPHLFPTLPSTEIDAAITAGWTASQLAHLAGYVLWSSQALVRPVGFLISELRKGSASSSHREARWSPAGIDAELQDTTYREWGTWVRRQMENALPPMNPTPAETAQS